MPKLNNLFWTLLATGMDLLDKGISSLDSQILEQGNRIRELKAVRITKAELQPEPEKLKAWKDEKSKKEGQIALVESSLPKKGSDRNENSNDGLPANGMLLY